ncbi:MAG: dihydrolipoyl dehydrogenase [Candidatus Omnitrophota bacterium]
MMEEYEIAIIGAGPAGYVTALRAAQKGFKTVVIEKDRVGGVCLNRGCIPTKALLESARQINLLNKASEFGIKINQFSIDMARIWEREVKIVENLRRGIEYLFKRRGVILIKGEATLLDKKTISIKEDNGEVERISAENIVIATGSSPSDLPRLKFDHENIISSDDILEKKILPHSLLIIGGGVIGCEFASLFSSLGTKVTIVELLKNLLPQEDEEISQQLEINFKKRGVKIFTERRVEKVEPGREGLNVFLSDGTNLEVEKVLVCVGRKPNTEGLGLEKLGVTIQNGWVVVDDYLKTNLPGIFAIGDVLGKTLLAHVAMYQGEMVVENIVGKNRKMDYSAIPNCIYTFPEVASVGIKENQAKALGIEYSVGRFPFRALGRAYTVGELDGFLKLIVDKKEKVILGAQAIGPEVTNIIPELVLAIKNRINTEQILNTIHAHPTFSEIIPEAIFSSFNFPLHTG